MTVNHYTVLSTGPKFCFCIVSLRSLALAVSVHPYCARKFTRHVIHRRALSNILNNDRADQDGHCYSLAGFNDLGYLLALVLV